VLGVHVVVRRGDFVDDIILELGQGFAFRDKPGRVVNQVVLLADSHDFAGFFLRALLRSLSCLGAYGANPRD